MKIYLASPFFTETEQTTYNKVIQYLRSQGHDVFVPQEHKIPNGENMLNDLWAEAVFSVDYLALCNCDTVVVLNYGLYSDSGTAWECGCAYALKKKIINVLCNNQIDYSLMMLNGSTTTVWLDDLYNWFDIKNLLSRKPQNKVKAIQK